MLTWPSPAMVTLPSRLTHRMVVPCHPIGSTAALIWFCITRQVGDAGPIGQEHPSHAPGAAAMRPMRPVSVSWTHRAFEATVQDTGSDADGERDKREPSVTVRDQRLSLRSGLPTSPQRATSIPTC